MARSSCFKPILRSSGAVLVGVLALGVLANAFVVYFVNQERYVYYWDNAGYWLLTLDIGARLVQNPLAALHSIISSVRHDDYNPLPVLPLIPFEWLFGTSRVTYILGITNIFALPAGVIIAVLALRVNHAEWSISRLLLGTATVLTLHSLWAPVLEGLPDVVGVVVIGGILLLHFGKPLADQKWSSLILTGLLLCLLVLLRRWYAFWVVGFFPALAVAQGLDVYQRHGFTSRLYITTARNAIIIGLTFLISLFALNTPFALKSITTDYSDIYSAYRLTSSAIEAAMSPPFYFGWTVFVGGLIGLARLAARSESRITGIFLLVHLLIVTLLFQRTQDFQNHHYYLLFPAIALGLVVVVATMATGITNRLWRPAALVLLVTLLFAGSCIVLVPEAAPIADILGSLAPKSRYHPLVRNDLDTLDSLLDRLGELELTRQGDIYVLASSDVLNSSIMQNRCRLGPRHRSFCDRILNTTDVDKRDGFPHQFLDALYVVLASPTQYHLRPEDQRVIGVLAREIMEDHGIGRSFQRLPGDFNLDEGVTASVSTKFRPLERKDLDALTTEFAAYYPNKRALFRIP